MFNQSMKKRGEGEFSTKKSCYVLERELLAVSNPITLFQLCRYNLPLCKEATFCSASPSFLATDNCVSCNCLSFSVKTRCNSRSFSLLLA